jgi:hypothetical protein
MVQTASGEDEVPSWWVCRVGARLGFQLAKIPEKAHDENMPAHMENEGWEPGLGFGQRRVELLGFCLREVSFGHPLGVPWA